MPGSCECHICAYLSVCCMFESMCKVSMPAWFLCKIQEADHGDMSQGVT